MSMRRICAVFALVAMAVLMTAGAASARDYPPTTSTVHDAGSAAQAPARSSSSGGLPFTGGNSAVLVYVGAACLGAGALAVVRTRRRSHA